MNQTELKREVRRQKALERLGTNHPACMHCSEDNPLCLERHHIAGRAYGDDTVIVCRNCHRKLSELQSDHPISVTVTGDPLESIGRFLLGLADIFELLLAKLREFGRTLIAKAAERGEVRT